MVKMLGKQKFASWVRVAMVSAGLIFCEGTIVQALSEPGVSDVLRKLVDEYSEKGFKLRKEHWSGKLEVGKHKVVKHQLFRGNEYWFWAAIPDDGYELIVEIFDGSGNPVSLEKFSNKGMSGARVLPVKTGTYLVKITLGEQKEKRSSARELDWALVYGYR